MLINLKHSAAAPYRKFWLGIRFLTTVLTIGLVESCSYAQSPLPEEMGLLIPFLSVTFIFIGLRLVNRLEFQVKPKK